MSALSRFIARGRTAYMAGMVGDYIRDVCTKAGRPEIYDPKVDYDGIFKAICRKYVGGSFLQLDPGDQEDVLKDALMYVITPETVKKCDPGLDPVKYFSAMFGRRCITAFKKRMAEKVKFKSKPGDSEQTDEEWMDGNADDSNDRPLDPEQALIEKQKQKKVLDDLPMTLKTFCQQHGKEYGDTNGWWAKMLDIGEQYGDHYPHGKIPNKEMAKLLGISQTAVSDKLKKMMAALLEWAGKTGQNELQSTLKQFASLRKHRTRTADDGWEIDLLSDIFRHVPLSLPSTTARQAALNPDGSSADPVEVGEVDETPTARQPAGNVTTVRVQATPDLLNDKYMSNLILSDTVTQARIDDQAKAFAEFLGASDDVIEDGASLIGLQIDSSSVRSTRGR